MEKRGIADYLGITFGLTWGLEGFLFVTGLLDLSNPGLAQIPYFIILACIPAVGALAASLIAPDPDHSSANIWPLPISPSIRIIFGVPLIFAIIFTLGSMITRADPQWAMGTMIGQLEIYLDNAGLPPINESTRPLLPAVLLVAGFVLSILVGVTLYTFLALGGEIGWRGYLLPRLMPLGRPVAHAATGFLWSLWLLPLVLTRFYQTERLHLALMFVLCLTGTLIALSMLLGELWRRTEHVGLCALCAGCFLGQATGIWEYLFPLSQLPWTKSIGIIAMAVWLAAACAVGLVTGPDSTEASCRHARGSVERQPQ